MKYIKTFEGHSIKKSKISKEELEQILQQINLVTLPFFDDESALLHHIEKNFDNNDGALVMNPSKNLTSVIQDGTTAMLYTKKKTYVIEDLSELEFEDFATPDEQQGGIPQ